MLSRCDDTFLGDRTDKKIADGFSSEINQLPLFAEIVWENSVFGHMVGV